MRSPSSCVSSCVPAQDVESTRLTGSSRLPENQNHICVAPVHRDIRHGKRDTAQSQFLVQWLIPQAAGSQDSSEIRLEDVQRQRTSQGVGDCGAASLIVLPVFMWGLYIFRVEINEGVRSLNAAGHFRLFEFMCFQT